MTDAATWNEWLVAEDCESVLAPHDFDEEAGREQLKALRPQIVAALFDYQVEASSPSLYQDSTAFVHFRILAKGDSGPFAPTLAWIVLSHFGKLSTIIGCLDADMLIRTAELLAKLGLRYIPYEYASKSIYDGRCRGLRGFSWANRYFEMCVEVNDQFRPEDYFI